MTPVDLLSREIYAFSDVDRLIGLTPGTGRRWIDGCRRSGKFYDPILRADSTGSDRVTWGEMVEARLVAEFRDQSVSLQRLRPAVERLRDQFGDYPLARARPLLDVAGRELVMQVQNDVSLDSALQLVVVRDGQLVLTDRAAEFSHRVTYHQEIAVRLVPQGRTPDVQMDPRKAFGQPSLRAVRTDVIAEDFRSGVDPAELADLYDLTPGQIDQALRFELILSSPRAA